MDFAGKTALITGASRGIGRAIAIALAKQGATIIINHFNDQEQAEQTAALCGAAQTHIFEANVADEEDCATMFANIQKDCGRLDILINNAGITRDNLIQRMSAQDFEDVLNVNLKGAFYCTKLAYKMMSKARFGRIINMASVVGLSGNIGQANYAASKAGLIALTKTAAQEYGRRNITVNAIAPGFIDTAMTADLPPEIKEQMLAKTALARFGQVEDIAQAALFLATAEYITGHTLVIDGGMAM